MTEAADIVAAMQVDIDRFGNQMGARTTRLARAAIVDLRADLDSASLGNWGVASKIAAMAQVHAGVERLAARQADVLLGETQRIAAASQGRMVALIDALDRKYVGAAAPVRFDTLAWLDSNVRQLSQTRLRVFSSSFARYGAAAVAEIEDELGKLALTGQPWTKARPRVHAAIRDVVGDRQWMVDRILRTETSAIYNGTNLAAMIAEDTPEEPVLKRLVTTWDKVTGPDSKVVDGQVRPVREMFFDGKRHYPAPPNRPHDREVVVPHIPGRWGPALPRLSRPPARVETSAPELSPAGPSRPAPTSPALAGRLGTTAAAVTLLAGRLQEQRRMQRALPPEARTDVAASLQRELDDAQLRLASARLSADIELRVGIAASGLQRGEKLTAGGLAVRVVAARVRGDAVEFELQIADQRLRGALPLHARLPFRRGVPTLTVGPRQAQLAMAMVAEALRRAVAADPVRRTSNVGHP